MEISPARIILMILWSMAFGGFCGVCNDVNRFVRALLCWENSSKLSGIKKIDAVKKYTFLAIAIVQDIFLFLLLGAGVSVLNYYFNNGELRIYTVISVSVGFFVYYLTLGRLVRWCLNGIAGGVKAVIFAIFRLVWTPFAIICSFFDKKFKKMRININNALAKKRKMMYNNKKVGTVTSEPEGEFVKATKK